SDFYDHEEETRRELRHVVQRGHDVAMLQLVSNAERVLPYRGQVEFEDMESGQRRLIDAGSISSQYEKSIRDFLERCRSGALRDGIDYGLLSTDTAPEVALRDFLLRRSLSESSPHAFGAIEK
ncbi:MAG: hypothetical protein ABJC26_14195, partial [Gemmatimonadaceae bacterium]